MIALVLIRVATAGDRPSPPEGATVVKTESGPAWVSSAYAKPDDPPAACRDSRRAITYYRQAYRGHREEMGLDGPVPRVWYLDCDVVRRRAGEWRDKAALAREALGEWRTLLASPREAICHVFGRYCRQALTVSSCETGGTYDTNAGNGQYLGLFQMGSSERARYGHGSTALEQARAAYRYFVASGRDWSPWQCSPYGGLQW